MVIITTLVALVVFATLEVLSLKFHWADKWLALFGYTRKDREN